MFGLKSLFGKSAPKSVRIMPAERAIAVNAGETILERALKDGIAYPHDCTVGTCGACRTKLLSGKVEAITPFGYTLSKEELAAGYILACQALPKSDCEVEIEIQADAAAVVRTPAKLVSTTPLTHDILRVEWQVEAPIDFKAGQYVDVRWNGGEIHRSYSFATAPEVGGARTITCFIRRVPGGAFTDALFDGNLADAAFELEGPHGQFYLRAGKGPMLCIAGGSGLAPLVSILQHAAAKRIRRDCILLFGARGQRDLYGASEISAIRSAWTAGFDYWPVLSEEEAPGFRHGFVTAHVAKALERLGPDAQAYLCGPPPMIDAAIAELTRLGVPLDAIFYDKFTDASTGKA